MTTAFFCLPQSCSSCKSVQNYSIESLETLPFNGCLASAIRTPQTLCCGTSALATGSYDEIYILGSYILTLSLRNVRWCTAGVLLLLLLKESVPSPVLLLMVFRRLERTV